MNLIPAFLKDDQLLNDIKSFNQSDSFRIWWLGQSGFLVKYLEKYLLLDPYLSDSLTVKYADTDKPHIRMSEKVIDPALLDFIDVVTSSHNHTDHLDAATLNPILAKNSVTKLIIPEANRQFVVERLGCPDDLPVGLDSGQTINIHGFKITALPAAHNEITYNEIGQSLFLSYIIQFGDFTIYHSGDTVWYDGLEKALSVYDLNLVLLPINGNKPERRVAGNLSAEEAAKLAKSVHADCVIPHHYHMFTFNTEDPLVFENFCQQYQTTYKILEIGEGVTLG